MPLISDPIGDMLTRIRNGCMRFKKQVVCPNSKFRVAVLRVLREHGYIMDFFTEDHQNGKSDIVIMLKYYNSKPVIKYLKRVSKPGCHLYTTSKGVGKCYNGLGITILSTSEGVMSDHKARKQNIGGEILCKVF